MSDASRPLVERVRDRVRSATRDLERHDREHPRRTRSAGSGSQQGEARALRKVFVGLGATYRAYRRRSGAPVSPAIRDAATAFRHEPSLIALVPVASFLDELELLDW